MSRQLGWRTRANFLDRLLVYHPGPWIERDWGKTSRLPLQDVWFSSGDGTKLFGWYVEASAPAGVLLWCHGNAGNIIHRLENLAELYRIGLSVFLFDYRGYGKSGGIPSEEGLYQDAVAAYAYLTTTRGIRADRLVLFGRSLGACVAGTLAGQRPVAGVILESPFPSIKAVVQATVGFPAHWLLESRYPLVERLKAIRAPILVFHGDQDTIIPMRLGREVYEAAPTPKFWYVIEGANHNDTYLVGGQRYFSRVKRFVEEVAR